MGLSPKRRKQPQNQLLPEPIQPLLQVRDAGFFKDTHQRLTEATPFILLAGEIEALENTQQLRRNSLTVFAQLPLGQLVGRQGSFT